MTIRWGVFAVAMLALAGCGDDDAGVTALFELPEPGAPPPSGFYGLPYPNDVRIGDDGLIDLSDHVRPNDLITEYIDVIAAEQRGYSISAASFFRFSGEIDPATLPATPDDSRQDGASVYLVDVDPDSPSRGERVPLRFRFETFAGESIGANWLSVLPYPGFVLREQTTYAVVVTDRVRAADGSALARDADFAAIAAASVPVDPIRQRAQELYQPLWDYLDEPGGDERGDVVSAAVYTTQDATSLLGKVRELVRTEVAAPNPRDFQHLGDETGYAWYDAVYDGPNFQVGTVPYMQSGGQIAVDADGTPQVERMEQLRVSFSVPTGTTMPADGWPVVLYAHGTGGSYHSYRGRAQLLAEQGFAVIGVDQVLHGPRAPNVSPEIAFFNLQNPMAARYNTLQGALDNFQLVRLVEELDYTDTANSRTIRFDPDEIYFFGHSQGGLTGPPFLAHEPKVKGAVLSGAGGLLYLSLLYKTEPVDIAGLIGAFIRDFPLDEFNNILALLQGWIDYSDPASFARYLVREPRAGVGAKQIFQTEGFIDRYTPPPAIEALAVAIGTNLVAPVVEPVAGLELRGNQVLTAPVTGNQDGVTSVLLQYEEASGSDGHFVVFDLPAARTQSAEFLGSILRNGVATVPAVD
jgi:pimeloyl-ACP methyl ester carboxylesterase